MLALAFHPTPSLHGWSPTPLTLRVEELRASDALSRTWRSLALRCLQGKVSLFGGSIAALQAATMLLLDAQEGSLALDAILVTAFSGAQKLGLHRLVMQGWNPLHRPPLPLEVAHQHRWSRPTYQQKLVFASGESFENKHISLELGL